MTRSVGSATAYSRVKFVQGGIQGAQFSATFADTFLPATSRARLLLAGGNKGKPREATALPVAHKAHVAPGDKTKHVHAPGGERPAKPSALNERRAASRATKRMATMEEEIKQLKADKLETDAAAKTSSSDGGDADVELDTSIHEKVKELRLQKKQIQQAPDFLLDKCGWREQQLAEVDEQLEAACAAQRESRPLQEQQAKVDNQFKSLNKQHEAAMDKLGKIASQLEELKEKYNEQAAAAAAVKVRIDNCKRQAAAIAEKVAAEKRERMEGVPSAQACPTVGFVPGSQQWEALGMLVRLANAPEVQTLLRQQGMVETALQDIATSVAAVQSTAAEIQQVPEVANTLVLGVGVDQWPKVGTEIRVQITADANAEKAAYLEKQVAKFQEEKAQALSLVKDVQLELFDLDDGDERKGKKRKKLDSLGALLSPA